MPKLKAIFLDRDGVINIDKEYLYKIEDFEFLPGIFEVLNYLRDKGYAFFVVTNQSGIARGFYSENDYDNLTKWMIKQLKYADIDIKKVEYCPHIKEDNCNCRKPKAGMLKNISAHYDIDLKNSWMVGDKSSDIEFALNCKIGNTIFVDTGKYSLTDIKPDHIIKDIKKIMEII